MTQDVGVARDLIIDRDAVNSAFHDLLRSLVATEIALSPRHCEVRVNTRG